MPVFAGFPPGRFHLGQIIIWFLVKDSLTYRNKVRLPLNLPWPGQNLILPFVSLRHKYQYRNDGAIFLPHLLSPDNRGLRCKAHWPVFDRSSIWVDVSLLNRLNWLTGKRIFRYLKVQWLIKSSWLEAKCC